MEARATFRETGISKRTVWLVIALMAGLLMAGTSAYILKAVTLSVASPATHRGRRASECPAWRDANRPLGLPLLSSDEGSRSGAPHWFWTCSHGGVRWLHRCDSLATQQASPSKPAPEAGSRLLVLDLVVHHLVFRWAPKCAVSYWRPQSGCSKSHHEMT